MMMTLAIPRLLLLLARLSVGMGEEDASKLEAALTPLVHNGQEQVDDGGDEDVDDDDSDRDRIW